MADPEIQGPPRPCVAARGNETPSCPERTIPQSSASRCDTRPDSDASSNQPYHGVGMMLQQDSSPSSLTSNSKCLIDVDTDAVHIPDFDGLPNIVPKPYRKPRRGPRKRANSLSDSHSSDNEESAAVDLLTGDNISGLSYNKYGLVDRPKVNSRRALPKTISWNATPPQEWKSWSSVKLRLQQVPISHCKPGSIYQLMAPYGVIKNIEVRGQGVAYVTFFPPPQNDFWVSEGVQVTAPRQKTHHIRMSLTKPKESKGETVMIGKKQYMSYMTLYAEQLTFGVLLTPTSMMDMKTISSSGELRAISLQTNLNRKELDLRFNLQELQSPSDHTEAFMFRLAIGFQAIEQVQIFELDDDSTAVIITVNQPPEVYKRVSPKEWNTNYRAEHVWNESRAWTRQGSIYRPNTDRLHFQHPIKLQDDHALIHLGEWRSFKFLFKKPASNRYLNQIINVLRDDNIKIIDLSRSEFAMVPKQECLALKYLELSNIELLQKSSSHGLNEMQSGVKQLSFGVLYQLLVCLSGGQINMYNLTLDFVQKLSEMDEAFAIQILEYAAGAKFRFYDPMDVFKNSQVRRRVSKVPNYASKKLAISVTPTCWKVYTPVVETSNRMERKFWHIKERFLRVRFVDEDYSRLYSRSDDNAHKIFARIRQAMKQGITIGDRHYEFLGCGNSQFREHSAYFFAPIKGLSGHKDMTTHYMRTCMGDLTHIKVPAKYTARLGQNFSTTRAIGLSVDVNYNIKDIKHGNYVFSDGVGKMSKLVAQLVAFELGLPNPNEDFPSAVQFRLGGCKGVLAYHPASQGRQIHIRPSQKKFDSKENTLEIIRVSQCITATLNRQIIIVLSALGVPDVVFRDMLSSILDHLAQAMDDSTIALSLLQRNIDFNQVTLSMAQMIQDGFMDCRDPFMMSILRLWRTWTIKYLKDKAKIPVNGASLLGCMDEFSVLKGHYNNFPASFDGNLDSAARHKLPEIFVQVDDSSDKIGTYRIVEGLCLVGRNPSLHPGDLRMVRAVDRPQLRHLKNCVVFPQTGNRDIPSMCSGGDLDGDDYLVIWDPLLFPKEWNHQAMDFTPTKPTDLKRPVNVDDMIESFILYMQKDTLPHIALNHLALADYSERGAKDSRCITLAALHSAAVDFPKTGISVELDNSALRVDKRPHFMQSLTKTGVQKNSYHSKKVLGQLYDMVELVDFAPEYLLPFDDRVLNAYKPSEIILETAKALKLQWDAALRCSMTHLSIATEFELFTCFVMSHNHMKKDYTLSEELGCDINGMKNQFRELCAQAAGGKTYAYLGPFITAMYQITAREVQDTIQYHKSHAENASEYLMPMISFPWIFQRELGIIAKGYQLPNNEISVKFNKLATGNSSLVTLQKSSGLKEKAILSSAANVPRYKNLVATESAISSPGTTETTSSDGSSDSADSQDKPESITTVDDVDDSDDGLAPLADNSVSLNDHELGRFAQAAARLHRLSRY